MLRSLLAMPLALATASPSTRRLTNGLLPRRPSLSAADGYVVIPGAAVPPDKAHKYLAIFDATRRAEKPTDLPPGPQHGGVRELNAFRGSGCCPSRMSGSRWSSTELRSPAVLRRSPLPRKHSVCPIPTWRF